MWNVSCWWWGHLSCKPPVNAWYWWQFVCNYFLCADLGTESAIVTTRYASFACTGIGHSNNLIIIAWVMICVAFIPATCQTFEWCMTCSALGLHGNLWFSHLLKIMLYQPSQCFQLFLTCFLNVFRNPFFIFDLDKQHPVWMEKLPMSVQFLPCLHKCSRVCPCVCGCIHEDSLSRLWWIPLVDWCLAVFPRHKGRTNVLSILALYSSLFDLIRTRIIRPWISIQMAMPSPQLKPFHNTPSNAECLYGSNLIL